MVERLEVYMKVWELEGCRKALVKLVCRKDLVSVLVDCKMDLGLEVHMKV